MPSAKRSWSDRVWPPGRLTLGELTERTEAAYTATTRGELARVTADPPAVSVSPPVPARPTAQGDREWVVAVMGDSKRQGRWRVERPLAAVAVMGDVVLDLRGAEVPQGEVDITAVAVMGDVEIYVPDGVDVQLSGIAVMGDKKVEVREAPVGQTAPKVVVRATVVMGDEGPGQLLRRAGPSDPARLAHPRRPRPPHHRVVPRGIQVTRTLSPPGGLEACHSRCHSAWRHSPPQERTGWTTDLI